MFRKPKTKNIRQRSRLDYDDDEDSTNKFNAPKIEIKTNYECDNFENDDNNKNLVNEFVIKPKNSLSFAEDEGDDIVNFKLKKSSRQSEKLSKKKHSNKRDLIQFSTKDLKKEIIEEDDNTLIIKEIKPIISKESNERKFKIPEKLDVYSNEKESIDNLSSKDDSSETDVRSRFALSFTDIPDAKAVYEARKKRELLRQGNGFIPLDDTIRLKNQHHNSSGERSRLIREDDDNDMSDDDNLHGKFYSSSSILITEEEQRRSDQTEFLKLEQGTSDAEDDVNSDEDELARWEREQIRKGVSVQKVNQLQNEINASNRFYQEMHLESEIVGVQDEMDVEIEVLESKKQPKFLSNGSFNGGGNDLQIKDVLEKLDLQINNKQEKINTTESNLKKIEDNIKENKAMISKLEANKPNLQQRFRMFQEMRVYSRDLLECLNEKISEINALEEQIFVMWKKRSEKLIKRQRQDVHDQYERCAAGSSGRQWVVPSPEYSIREAEREGRRSRRRREREKKGIIVHNEGLSSDDEETTSQKVVYSDTIASVTERANNVFIDASDDFCDIKKIITRFIDWYTIDQKSYNEAYISLCLPKIISPFVRLELINWSPLQESAKLLHTHNWYKKLLAVGLDNMGIEFESDEIINIIPSVVEKVILPKITKIIDEQWNPLSLSESKNLANFLNKIVDEYPTVNSLSKRVLNLLNSIYKKAKISIDEDMFVPIYSKEAVGSIETGCCSFLDRQFWKSVKLITSLMQFKNLLSNSCLEELVIEGIVNRSSVLALQFSTLSDSSIINKCLALVAEIPTDWLPSSKPQSYGPLAALLSQVIEQHRLRNKSFCKQMQKFIDLIRND